MGSRLLRHWLHHPLRDRSILVGRHEAVGCLDKDYAAIQSILRKCADVERITARLALKSVRPRELAGLRDTLKLLPELRQALPDATTLLKELIGHLSTPEEALFILQHAVHPEPATRVVDGGVIADGYNAGLDELRQLQSHSGEFLVSFEAKEKRRTGIP